MPRPPSEITGSSIQIAVRVTTSLKNEFKNLGGAVWLRKLLAQSINNRKNNETVPTPTANTQTSDKRP